MAKGDRSSRRGSKGSSGGEGDDTQPRIPPYDTRDHWPNWRLQAWATRASKREEKYWVDNMPVKHPGRGWKAMKRDYEEDPSVEFRTGKFLDFLQSRLVKEDQLEEIMTAVLRILGKEIDPETVANQPEVAQSLMAAAIISRYPGAEDAFLAFVDELKQSQDITQISAGVLKTFDGRKIPDRMLSEIVEDQRRLRLMIPRRIKEGVILPADDPTNDHALIEMQWAIDTMVKDSGILSESPKLLIHKPGSHYEFRIEHNLQVHTEVPEYIHISQEAATRFTIRPNELKAVMAHELGHIHNGDLKPENILAKVISRPTQMREILADRAGALIHGNPRQYAKDCKSYLFNSERKAKKEQERKLGEKISDRKHMYTDTYLSDNGRIRMLHKWADILEGANATDEKGNLIMEEAPDGTMKPLRALEVYERSKDFTEGYLKASLAFDVSHPRPPARR